MKHWPNMTLQSVVTILKYSLFLDDNISDEEHSGIILSIQ